MKHLTLLSLALVLLVESCQSSYESPSENLSKVEHEFFLERMAFENEKIESPDSARDYLLSKGYSQIPIEEHTYTLAGLYDKKGEIKITQERSCRAAAYVKKFEQDVGLILFDAPCANPDGAKSVSATQGYFFTRFELHAGQKCDRGNSIALEWYLHYQEVNGQSVGVGKTVKTVHLCFDGVLVQDGSIAFQ